MHKLSRLTLIIICTVTTLIASANDKNIRKEVSETAIDRIERNLLPNQYLLGHVVPKSIPQVMLEDNIPGVSIAFVDQGKIKWEKSYGYADLQMLTKVTPETVFTGASLSKPIAAVAALQLVDKGLVSLDEDVNNKLKSWKVPDNSFTETKKVTLRHLIGHTAGISNFVYTSYGPNAKIPTSKQILSGESPSVDPAAEIVAEPGERYKYSNPGYTIIERLIEDISGKGFEAVVGSEVLSQVDMQDSSFIQPMPGNLMKRKATGYSKELKAYTYKLFPFQAAGGIWTTPKDLAKFMMALMNDYHKESNTLVSKKIADQIFSKTPNRLGFTKQYSEQGNDLIFEHWGSNEGFTSYMVGSLDDNQGLVIMTNSDNGFGLMAAISRAVAQEYNWDLLKPRVYESVSIGENTLKTFVGTYGDGKENGEVSQFSVKKGNLYLFTKGKPTEQKLIPIGESKLISPSEYITYEFIRGRDNSIKWVRITHESGWNYDLIKY